MVYRGNLKWEVPVMETENKGKVISEDDEKASTEEQVETVEDVEVIDEQIDEEVDVERLKAQIESLKEEKETLTDRVLRLQAEFENYKRRTNKERIAERKYKSQDLANELLPALDNFERALQVEVTDANKGIIDGITMVYNQLQEAFKSQGIEQIETENKQFDPNLHHAVMQTDDENFESNIIVEELQKGYIIEDRVIRAAMVKVNK